MNRMKRRSEVYIYPNDDEHQMSEILEQDLTRGKISVDDQSVLNNTSQRLPLPAMINQESSIGNLVNIAKV